MIYSDFISSKAGVAQKQVDAALSLLEEGATIPFVARYRKEKTGGLDEVQLRQIQELHTTLQALEARRIAVLKSIGEQGKLSPELKEAILKAETLQEVEDLYLPFKKKRKTRASLAREMGLEPLARFMVDTPEYSGDIGNLLDSYVIPEEGVQDRDTALAGAKDIVAEMVAESAEVRKLVRGELQNRALLVSAEAKRKTPKKGKKDVYQVYRNFRKPVRFLKGYQVLALNRGERDGFLSVKFEFDRSALLTRIVRSFFAFRQSRFGRQLKEAVEDGFDRLILPSVEREIRAVLTEKADAHAIEVFAANLRQLLLQPPISGRVVLGIDPGFVSGCKLAVVDATGAYLEGATIYPHPPQKKTGRAAGIVTDLIRKHTVGVIAIGNGTASRETEQFVAELIRNERLECRYLIVSEAGASVYSASKLAGEEFPNLDATQRGNISIARRVVDPLAELVKIDPKSVGVGLYQHDVDQKALSAKLDTVVESCVNHVGVDLNTASVPLLRHVSGLNKKLSAAIVGRRETAGPFRSRKELLSVSGLGAAKYEQAAGFLRIRNGVEPLDSTAIHPESYPAVKKMLEIAGCDFDTLCSDPELLDKIVGECGEASLANRIGVGIPTFRDIVASLGKPGRDPREELPPPVLRSDVLKMEDLHEGMRLQGTVRNVVDFGVFVDIGVKQDGLLHISRLSGEPQSLYHVGDVAEVVVESIDMERARIALAPAEE